jgi:hypothetical protein
MDSLLQIPDDEQRSRSCQSRSQVLEYTWLERQIHINGRFKQYPAVTKFSLLGEGTLDDFGGKMF